MLTNAPRLASKRRYSQVSQTVLPVSVEHDSTAKESEQPQKRRKYKRKIPDWDAAPQAGLPTYVATDPPQFIDGIEVGRQEQRDLFNWVKSQLHVRPGLDPEVLPPERRCLQKWDSVKHSRLIKLGGLIKSRREAQPGSTKMGLAGHLAEVWGLMNAKKGKNGSYTLQDLKENAQACNSSFISQEKLECSPETAQRVLLFTCDFARKWNSCPSNPLRGGKVLTHALGNQGIGMEEIAAQTGMLLGDIKDGQVVIRLLQPGHRKVHKQLQGHLMKYASQFPDLVQEGLVPTLAVLAQLDDRLRWAVKAYKKDQRRVGQTGQQALAEDLGWTAAPPVQYPSGHWQDLANCQAAVHEYIREHDLADTPPMPALRTALPSMVAAVVRVHFPNNGWSRFIRSCGLSPLRVPKGLLSQEYVDEVLLQILSASDTPHIMPTETQMRALARDPEYSMRREAGSLSVSIGRSLSVLCERPLRCAFDNVQLRATSVRSADLGGGWRVTADRLNLEMLAYEPIVDQERELLASVLADNPSLHWTKVKRAYCVKAASHSLPARSASALHHMLTRAPQTSLQLLRCARMLSLSTPQQTDKLDNLVAADFDLLQRMLKYSKQLRRLCSTASEDVFTVIGALPAGVTDEEWASNLEVQCEIEANVALWHSALKKAGFRRKSRKEVWKRPELVAYSSQRFRLKLDANMVCVVQTLVQEALTAGVEPSAWDQHGSYCDPSFKSKAALKELQRLELQPDSQFRFRSIHSIPLTQTASGMIHDQSKLPVLPEGLQHHQVKWSPFHKMSFENAKTLLQKAGALGGIYQIWLCLYETQADGTQILLMRTEWYVGSGIVLAGRVCDYLPVNKCGPPGPKWEAAKRMLFQAAWERGFDFEIRFLPLKGMSLSDIRAVEDHYLQCKWPMNKVHNGNVRVHPDWSMRLLSAVVMLQHISMYPEDTRRKQGLSRLGISAGHRDNEDSDEDNLSESDVSGSG